MVVLPGTGDGVGHPLHAEVEHVAHLGVGVGEVAVLPAPQTHSISTIEEESDRREGEGRRRWLGGDRIDLIP